MTDSLVEVLYLIAGGLLLPVLLVLLALLGTTLVALGGLARESLERNKAAPAWRRFLRGLRSGDVASEEFYDFRWCGYAERFRRETAPFAENNLGVRKCLEDLEIDAARRLARLALATRVGPMLGLVGTLIPLGPALTGLAEGNMETLSGNLIIAFATTVFGILIGGLAYAMGLVRRAWYEQDLSDLEFVAAGRAAAAQPAHSVSPEPRLV
jgi:biopolymer transport protein ExbB/TolQ